MEQWFKLSIAEQLGNIGSEYERALKWKEKGQSEHFQSAFERMLKQLDWTLSDKRWDLFRLKEIARVREQVCAELTSDQAPGQNLKKYFFQFASLARSHK